MKASATTTQKRKTRTGCNTCKSRRVKCDEQKPSCLRCLATKRICEGYSPALQQNLPCDSLSDQERRAFLFFRSRTANRIFGRHDASTWLPTLLQFGINETSVKYAITALASLHESMEPGNASTSIRPSQRHAQITAQMLALRYYTSAIKSVHTESHTMSTRPDIVMTLCILFLCFEQFRNADAACLLHLKSGLKLLYWWRHRTTTYNTLQEYSRPTLEFMNNQITPIMQRLRVQFSLCMDSRHTLKDLGVPLCLPFPKIPPVYNSLNSVRNDFDRVMNYIFSSSERGQLTECHLPRRSLTTALRQWKHALDSSDLSSESPMLRECTVNLLELYFHVSIIITETYGAQSETIFDQYTTRFQTVVDLAMSITETRRQELQGFSLIFSFDLGITPPMFLVASRCRHPLIRRRAVNLMLESPFYHGAWQDRYSGLCARRIIELEEQDTPIIGGQRSVSEEHRVRKVAADLQEERSQISMQFTRWPFTTDSPVFTTVINLEPQL